MRALIFLFLLALVSCRENNSSTSHSYTILIASNNTVEQDRSITARLEKAISQRLGVPLSQLTTRFQHFPPSRDNDAILVHKIATNSPDVIISSSEDVVERIGAHRPELPIVAFLNRNRRDRLAQHTINFTGFVADIALEEKRIEIISSCLPERKKLALVIPGDATRDDERISQIRAVATKAGIEVIEWRVPDFIETKVPQALRGIGAAYVFMTISSQNEAVLLIAIQQKLNVPTIFEHALYVEKGGMLSLDADPFENIPILASLATRVLQGVRPSVIPIERPRKIRVSASMGAMSKSKLTKRCASEIIKSVTEWHP
jgi:ABC-type uncharacterized transport system substrate-binding protein